MPPTVIGVSFDAFSARKRKRGEQHANLAARLRETIGGNCSVLIAVVRNFLN
jgi:hypothetical protein